MLTPQELNPTKPNAKSSKKFNKLDIKAESWSNTTAGNICLLGQLVQARLDQILEGLWGVKKISAEMVFNAIQKTQPTSFWCHSALFLPSSSHLYSYQGWARLSGSVHTCSTSVTSTWSTSTLINCSIKGWSCSPFFTSLLWIPCSKSSSRLTKYLLYSFSAHIFLNASILSPDQPFLPRKCLDPSSSLTSTTVVINHATAWNIIFSSWEKCPLSFYRKDWKKQELEALTAHIIPVDPNIKFTLLKRASKIKSQGSVQNVSLMRWRPTLMLANSTVI